MGSIHIVVVMNNTVQQLPHFAAVLTVCCAECFGMYDDDRRITSAVWVKDNDINSFLRSLNQL